MHLRATINMVALHSGNRDGVVSMDSQIETVPGPQPQRGPLPATGVSDPEHVASKGQRRPTCVSLDTKVWGSTMDLFLTFKYAALTGERIYSTQPSHQMQKKNRDRFLLSALWSHTRRNPTRRSAGRELPLWPSG